MAVPPVCVVRPTEKEPSIGIGIIGLPSTENLVCRPYAVLRLPLRSNAASASSGVQPLARM